MTPFFVVEEHHEALIAWVYAINNGWIPPEGNSLLHVDEHSDMVTPCLDTSLNEVLTVFAQDPDRLEKFVYEQLVINTFIIPACYMRIISEVFWIRQKHPKPGPAPIKMYVRSYNANGKKLISGTLSREVDLPSDADRVEFDYWKITESEIPQSRGNILDIDLDYFSCTGDPNSLNPVEIEISEDEYSRFVKDRFHRIRFLGLRSITARRGDGKYYLTIGKFRDIYPSPEYVDRDTIDRRLEKFFNTLAEKQIKPDMIDICRSRISGYTPADQWEYIEERLIGGLNNLYGIKRVSL